MEIVGSIFNDGSAIEMEVQKLVVEVHRATAIQDVNMFTKQDPYVKAALLPEKTVTARTLEAYAGGTEPTWDEGHENRLVLTWEEEETMLEVEIWNQATMGDELIGTTEVDLDEIKFQPEPVWFDMKPQGKLLCSFAREGAEHRMLFKFARKFLQGLKKKHQHHKADWQSDEGDF